MIELICEYVPIFADQVRWSHDHTDQSEYFYFNPLLLHPPQCKVILDNFDQYWKFLQEEVVSAIVN